MFLTIALVFSYLESLLPVFIPVPGVKLGLANVVTMLILYRGGMSRAFAFMLLRVLLSGLLFSGPAGIIFSLAGGTCCILFMAFVKGFSCFSLMGVSMIGAVAHNVGQIIVAYFIIDSGYIFAYFPVLCISGLISGFFVGYISFLITQFVNHNFSNK